jgi:hypothetical protein
MVATATAVRRDAFLEVGGFHRRYGVGGEETLLALDLRAAGWDVCYLPEAVIHHCPSAAARTPARRRRTMVRNDLWTLWLRLPIPSAVAGTLRRLRRSSLPDALVGTLAAAAGWRLIRDERQVLPPDVLAELRQVQQVRGALPAQVA